MKDDYAYLVSRLTKPGQDIVNELTPEDAHQIHMIMGVSGEAGELLDAIKKAVIYRKKIDMENVIEELGDIEFYMEGLRQSFGLSREEIVTQNMRKLTKRYSDGSYSDAAAKNRADKQG